MSKFRILGLLLLVGCGTSCSFYSTKNRKERVISSSIKGNETGNPLSAYDCLGKLDIDVDPIRIQKNFQVELSRDSNFPSINEARNLCLSKITSFGHQCNFRNWSTQDRSTGRIVYKSEAEPIVDADFLKKYRQHLVCNRIIMCQQQASDDETVSVNMIDKLHRIYENNNCNVALIEKKVSF